MRRSFSLAIAMGVSISLLTTTFVFGHSGDGLAKIEVEPAQPRTGRPAKYASAHDLRRSCGERLRNAGVPPLVICRVMRHSSWETTRKHYAPGDIQKDAEVLSSCLTAPSTDR